MENLGTDFIVSSLLSELKNENNRKGKLIKELICVIIGAILSTLLVVAGFLLYLNQYDFVSNESITATGVYTLVDSKGNVVAQDLTSEDISYLMEVLNGDSQEKTNQSEG